MCPSCAETLRQIMEATAPKCPTGGPSQYPLAQRIVAYYRHRRTDGRTVDAAIRYVAKALDIGTAEVRLALIAAGESLRQEPVKVNGHGPRAPQTKRPKPLEEPKPAPTAIVRAEYRDDAPVRFRSDQELLDELRAKGEKGRFVPVSQILAGAAGTVKEKGR